MADSGDPEVEDAVEVNEYKVPVKKTLEEIQKMDEEDESLKRYKQALLGGVTSDKIVLFPENPDCAVIQKLFVCVVGQPEHVIDLTGDLKKIRDDPVKIVEGSNYSVKVQYCVQRDIVTGLRYEQSTHRGIVPVDHCSIMVGSYGPQQEPRIWCSETFEAPRGAMHRGKYTVKSSFIDIDKKEYIKWKWTIAIVKDSASPD